MECLAPEVGTERFCQNVANRYPPALCNISEERRSQPVRGGNRKWFTFIPIIILYYNIKVLWDHRRICGQSLTETSLCGAYLYFWSCGALGGHILSENALKR